MNEYVCHYLTDAVHSARAVYHADTLATAMAMHNASKPEHRDKVLKWVGPTGTTFLMHDSTLSLGPENLGTIWVCQDCMLHHANGECGGCHEDYGHDCTPLSMLGNDEHVAMGMDYEEHAEGCQTRIEREWRGECDCETNTFSTSQCEGCGSYLHGERHAMTLFKS